MPRVYDFDYRRYHTPSYTIANEVNNGLGNEYFKRTNYLTSTDRAAENEKQFSTVKVTPKEGEGIVDTVLNVGKTALNFAKNNKELISAVGSIAGAASQISRAEESAKQLEAIKKIRDIREAAANKAPTPPTPPAASSTTAPSTATAEAIKKIRNNFDGRGIRKKKTGGVIRSF